jgi:hypothetical protein
LLRTKKGDKIMKLLAYKIAERILNEVNTIGIEIWTAYIMAILTII